MKFALFGHTYQQERSIQIKKILEVLQQYEAELYICREFYQFIVSKWGLEPKVSGLIDDDNFSVDMALSIGGDGTFLKTAMRVGDKGIPILGINTGTLGFLADVLSKEVEDVIGAIYKNWYLVEERSLLELEVVDNPFKSHRFALNEIAILKQDLSSMITLRTYIDGAHLHDYRSDGLIIATPSGSTAYSMSVGGPIVMPGSGTILINPIAPHSLTVRPLVLTDQATIDLQVEGRGKHFLIALDGRSEIFDAPLCLTVRRAPFTVKVVKRHNHNYFDTLREKLLWGADVRR